jgi:hypothetical protein
LTKDNQPIVSKYINRFKRTGEVEPPVRAKGSVNGTIQVKEGDAVGRSEGGVAIRDNYLAIWPDQDACSDNTTGTKRVSNEVPPLQCAILKISIQNDAVRIPEAFEVSSQNLAVGLYCKKRRL